MGRVFHGAHPYSSLPIDFAPMSDLMNHNNHFGVKNLVDDAVVAYSEFTIPQGRLYMVLV